MDFFEYKDLIYYYKFGSSSRVYIKINNEGKIILTYPESLKFVTLIPFIEKTYDAVKNDFLNSQNNIKRITDQNSILILDNEYRIKYVQTPSRITNDSIFLKAADESKATTEFYKLAIKHFHTFFENITRQKYISMQLNDPFPIIKLKNVKSSWGSYNISKNIITYNVNLIFKTLPEIEYIVVHELAHLVHFNHSRLFWQLVRENCQNYKHIKKLLSEGN